MCAPYAAIARPCGTLAGRPTVSRLPLSLCSIFFLLFVSACAPHGLGTRAACKRCHRCCTFRSAFGSRAPVELGDPIIRAVQSWSSTTSTINRVGAAWRRNWRRTKNFFTIPLIYRWLLQTQINNGHILPSWFIRRSLCCVFLFNLFDIFFSMLKIINKLFWLSRTMV